MFKKIFIYITRNRESKIVFYFEEITKENIKTTLEIGHDNLQVQIHHP